MIRRIGLGYLFLLLVSCSSDPADAPVALTSEATQELSNHEQCDTADATFTFHDNPCIDSNICNSFVPVAPPYGSSKCAGAALFDVTRFHPRLTSRAHISVQWADLIPSNATDCANASLWTYMFLGDGGADKIEHGTWLNGACQLPPIKILQGTIKHRYAVSARQGNSLRGLQFSVKYDR